MGFFNLPKKDTTGEVKSEDGVNTPEQEKPTTVASDDVNTDENGKKVIYLTGSMSDRFTKALNLMFGNEDMMGSSILMTDATNPEAITSKGSLSLVNSMPEDKEVDMALHYEDTAGLTNYDHVVETMDGLRVSLSQSKTVVLGIENNAPSNKYSIMLEKFATMSNIRVIHSMEEALRVAVMK